MTSPRIALNFEEGRNTADVIQMNTQEYDNLTQSWHNFVNGPMREALADGSGDALIHIEAWFNTLAEDLKAFMFGTGGAMNVATDTLQTAALRSRNAIESIA